MTIELYAFPPSPRAFKVMVVANHLGLDWTLRPLDLIKGEQKAPEYAALNPNMRMPTLKDGDYVLWESGAILQYLAGKKPDSGLLPTDETGRLNVTRWQFWDMSHWDPACAIFLFENVVKAVILKSGEPDRAQLEKVPNCSTAPPRSSTISSSATDTSPATDSPLPTSRSAPRCITPPWRGSRSSLMRKSPAGTARCEHCRPGRRRWRNAHRPQPRPNVSSSREARPAFACWASFGGLGVRRSAEREGGRATKRSRAARDALDCVASLVANSFGIFVPATWAPCLAAVKIALPSRFILPDTASEP